MSNSSSQKTYFSPLAKRQLASRRLSRQILFQHSGAILREQGKDQYEIS